MKSRIFCTILLIFCCRFVYAQTQPYDKQGQRFMEKFAVRLEKGTATQQDLMICQNFWKTAPSESAKRPFLLLAAQYQRKIAQNPVLCVEMLLPTLGIPHASNQNNASNQSVKKKQRSRSLKTPPLEEWKIESENALCAVEIANCLLEDGQIELALQIIDAVGRNFSDESRVLAAETGGDIYVKMKMLDQAIEFYSFGLKTLETLKKKEYEPGKGERVFFSKEQNILKKRITQKLSAARKSQDKRRYGPDWVAYRDARTTEFSGDFLTAYQLYEKVINSYPKTIYAEASRSARIVLLTKFADSSNLERIPEFLTEKQQELSEARRDLLIAKKSGKEADIEKYQKKIDELTSFIEFVSNLPTGLSALKQAEAEAEAFIAEDPYGLYRGEVMLKIGLCYLTVFFEPEIGEKWLNRTGEWIEETQKLSQTLQKFQVPDASVDVSRPSDATFHRDEWGNLRDTKPKAGDLANRLTCVWYLDQLKAETERFLGFLDFVRGDMKSAMVHFVTMRESDDKVRESLQQGEPNMFDRLLFACEQGRLRRATKEDLKPFKGRQRFIILLADFYSTVEKFDKAWKITERFLNGEYGKYDKGQEAYLRFACAWALWADSVASDQEEEYEDKAAKILHFFLTDQGLQKQPIAPRALYIYANQCRYREKLQEAVRVCRFIEKNYKKSPYCEEAWFLHGCTLLYTLSETPPDPADIPEGLMCMKKILSDFPKGYHRKFAMRAIKEFEGEK